MKKEDGGHGMINFINTCNVVKIKKFIGSIRMRNNVGKRIKKQIEVLQMHSGFSTNIMKIKDDVKFWMRTWIDEIATTFKECNVDVGLQTWTPMSMIDERATMDHAIEHAEKTSEMRMINKVRLHKNAMFLFEIIGSNGRKPIKALCNNEMKSQCSIVSWSDTEQVLPTKKEFRAWEKFVNHIRNLKHKMGVLQRKTSSNWKITADNKCACDDEDNVCIKLD